MIKKITLLLLFVVAFSWHGTAQMVIDDFEGGMVNLVNATGNDTDFVVETTLFHGGAQSVKNAHGTSETNILEQAATMDLSGVTNPVLEFWHIAKTEGGYDKCYVEISTDGGATYTALTSTDYLGAAADYATEGYFHEYSYTEWGDSDTPAADNTWWKKEEFSLAAYIGTTVKVRFRLEGDSSTNREGWYIDDVTVSDPVYISPAATYTAVGDCANSQFSVDVDVVSLGGAASVTVADDQSSTAQSVSATGIVTFGPYPSGSTVAFTVTNDADSSYTTGDSVTYICPPANDACADATEVASLPYTDSVDATEATNNDGFITACSSDGMNDGIWYTFTVGTSGTVTIAATSTGWDAQMNIYTGSCGAFTCVASNDSAYTGGTETYDLTAIAGTQYWVNIGYWSDSTDGSEGPVDVSITTADGATLGTQEAQGISGFAYYPNPVNNQLSLRANNAIDQVEILNILGQTVLTTSPSTTSTAIDMTALNQGTYFVRVQAGDAIQTVKVIKN